MRRLLPAVMLLLATPALAADPAVVNGPATTLSKYPCPTSKACRVVTIDDDEMKILAGANGILQTAAQARSLDLGQYVIYFQNKLQNAPAGEPKQMVREPEANAASPSPLKDTKSN